MLALRSAFPELRGRCVVQYVGVMIDQIEGEVLKAAGVEAMEHDFYTPQPLATRGAKVYYLRTVLHDWPDDKCQVILSQLRDALASDSVIVIDEIVLPEMGASTLQMVMDLTMMASVGARERSEGQWRELLKSVGLRMREVVIYDEGLHSGLIIAVKA